MFNQHKIQLQFLFELSELDYIQKSIDFLVSHYQDDFKKFDDEYKKDLDLYTRLQYLDFHTYLHDDIFTKVDRVSMAVSLECRVPFMKKEIIEYSFSIKKEVRIYQDELKGAMKEAFMEILPIEIIERDKKGFSIPMNKWRKLVENNLKKQEKILIDFGIIK